MDIAQLIITIAGFIGLFIYQHYKIRTLKDQNKSQSEILNNLKTYSDIIKPEIFKSRVEQYEKLIEKESSFEIKQIQEKLSKEMETKIKMYVNTQKKMQNLLKDILPALGKAMYYLPSKIRQTIVNEIQDDTFQKSFQALLPIYEEYDMKVWPSLLSALSGDTESPKQNEK